MNRRQRRQKQELEQEAERNFAFYAETEDRDLRWTPSGTCPACGTRGDHYCPADVARD